MKADGERQGREDAALAGLPPGSMDATRSENRLYQAMRDKDGRFDGLFFSGIVTTGVYCRAVCPVPRPARQENVRFFTSVAAAEGAGFRPCLRCHPERSAGTPVWGPFPPVVSRALELIVDGALDEGGVDGLARRVGLGARQLRRLFSEHLGASPLAVAKARRVHFARCLVHETGLPMADVAFASGFRSLRQFNHDFRKTFGRSPQEIRRRPERAARGVIAISLPYRPPLDWPRMAAFLQQRAMPGVEVVGHDRYRRAVEVDGELCELEVAVVPDQPKLVLRVWSRWSGSLRRLAVQARRVFDLDADPLRIGADLARSETLAPLVKARPGLRLPGAWDPFELSVRAVLGQQISVRAATTLTRRLIERYGRPIESATGGVTHLFPTAGVLAGADLLAIGATNSQERAIQTLSAAVAVGELRLDASQGLEDFIDRFCILPGVGPWTAHYVAMRALREPDAFPAGDLGLRRALGGQGRPITASALARLAEEWRPWRSYAAMYLWTNPQAASSRSSR
jgi:AraC family transcriptional regulator, regulatory protein of adaptative response / DNA-3-methyladenine glycosylase II